MINIFFSFKLINISYLTEKPQNNDVLQKLSRKELAKKWKEVCII